MVWQDNRIWWCEVPHYTTILVCQVLLQASAMDVCPDNMLDTSAGGELFNARMTAMSACEESFVVWSDTRAGSILYMILTSTGIHVRRSGVPSCLSCTHLIAAERR